MQYVRPAVGEECVQFANELPAYQSCDLMAPIRLCHQPAEHLHPGDVVLA